ncbi:DUF5954 family protein [Streptomyces sp. NPDC059578]|uniref:DUF5954 family protein n=1 Tax=Streptomyces sp. NPDC059578 TaxID=3346874 RepID=UPI0036C3509A
MGDDWKRQLDRVHDGLVQRDDPAEWVTEADAVEASYRYPHLLLRGPVFGLAVQEPDGERRWSVLTPVMAGRPQEARDSLNSHLWFKAKDDTDDPAARRELLAAVAVLEREPVNEVAALGRRYRVVRGDEFARGGAEGLEPPRSTDPEPADRSWEFPKEGTPLPEVGTALDPARERGLMAEALKLALRDFCYQGTSFSREMREDSARAVRTHPEVALLPVGFCVAERQGERWRPRGALAPTPHDARRLLFDALRDFWPRAMGLDARRTAAYARAAERFRAAARADEVRVGGEHFRVCRIERMVRWGEDGPEGARASDVDAYGPERMHPRMDEDGTVHFDE